MNELERWFSVQQFLVHEASLLDDQRFDDWLALLADDVRYRVPVRLTARRGCADLTDEMFLMDETHESLSLRVRRLATDVAWAEDPPSRTRRHVANVMVDPGPSPGTWTARSNLLMYRSRLDRWEHDLVSARRDDVLRSAGDGYLIASRNVTIDQSTVATKNLGVFL